jgi:hypothetical protein
MPSLALSLAFGCGLRGKFGLQKENNLTAAKQYRDLKRRFARTARMMHRRPAV